MTKAQKNLIVSWIVGVPTFIVALYSVDDRSLTWVVILIAGFGICRFIRKDIEIEPWRPFEVMGYKARLASLLYYLCVLCFVVYVVLVKPGAVSYDVSQFLLLVVLIFLPVLPVVLKRELYIYQLAGDKND